MKILKSVLTCAFVALSVCANAQFQNAGSSSGTLGMSGDNPDHYNRFQIGYATGKLRVDGKSADEALKGMTGGWIVGKSISSTMPLFWELGLNATWLHYSEDDYKFNYLNMTIPVNVAYRIGLSEGLSLAPHAGINFKGNLLATEKDTYGKESESFDYFDKDDVGKDDTWNRFQIGGQIGVGFNYKGYYLGYQYQFDFMELAKKTKLPNHSIVLGFPLGI